MNILVIGCKNYPAFSSNKVISGGMEVYVWELFKYLRNKYTFTIISGYSQSDNENITVINVPIFGGFALQPISLCVYSFFVSIWLVLSRKRIDLVNAQTPLIGLIGYILKKLFRIPYVVSVHIFAADEDHVGRLSKIYGFIEKLVLGNSDKVISAGYRLKRFLDSRYGFNKDHVIVINPGMDLPGEVLTPPSSLIKEVINETSYKILFLGRLIEENGLIDLLETMKLLKNDPVKLYIAGNGNLESVIRNSVKREKLNDKVKMLGIVKGTDKAHLIRNVNLSIRTSYHEVFPVAYLESIAFGVPVIATPVGDTEYLAEKTGAIFLVPKSNPLKVAETIKMHMKDGPLSPNIIMRCKNYIGSISWAEQARRTEELFDAILLQKERQ